jgi:hypothetical protein
MRIREDLTERGKIMREHLQIVLNPALRDARIERRVQELNREKAAYGLMLAGAVLLIIALL